MMMTLNGCCAEPLGSYLKALAVLRLVSEQTDSDASGCWGRASFELETTLDQDGLVEFFLRRYRPTPILAPWNGGSGFYPKDRKLGLNAIECSKDERFAVYRLAIAAAKEIDGVSQRKGESKIDEDERRAAILRTCRNALPEACVEWLDAAVGLSADGSRAFAPILGTGGNEGRLDYTNNFMEYISGLLLEPKENKPIEGLLRNALFGDDTAGLEPSAVGQYDPGRAGGFNQGSGVETKNVPSNPWNFVLTLEGAVAWASGLYRRQGISYRSFLCSPFTVKPSSVGYGSAADKDESLARAEVWTPIWTRAASYAELQVLLREGRASLDAKPAKTGLEFAEAASMLGVDRGIDRFVRYSLLKRRGDSYIALPTGQFRTGYRSHADLIRQCEGVLNPVDRLPDRPTAYLSLRRQVDEAIYQALLREEPSGLLDVATAFGRLHKWILRSGWKVRLQPALGQEWIGTLQDQRGQREVRISAALAGIYDRDIKALRENLDANSNQFAWVGGNFAERLISVLERRTLTANAMEAALNPVASAYRAAVQDVSLFIEGSLDDSLIENLLFAFTLVRWNRESRLDTPRSDDEVEVWPVYALIKHLFLPGTVKTPNGDVRLRADLTVLSLLKAGKIREAAERAVRRLRIAELSPIEAEYSGGIDGTRLAAALLIPITYGSALSRPVLKRKEEKEFSWT